jgi:osmotically-inducible protein OsmY
MATDKAIQHDVMAELEWEPSLDAANIGVAVHNGVVTLSGHVGSYLEKRTAERAVRKVNGVRAIAQELSVVLPGDRKVADDAIAERASRIIAWNVGAPPGAVQIKVERGWITLSGEVDWQYQKERAERDVEKLSGVVGVINHMTVKARVSPADIRGKIEAAFRRNAELESSGITVRAEDTKVILSGQVHAWYEREVAERAAWSAPGVTQVEDHITVG